MHRAKGQEGKGENGQTVWITDAEYGIPKW